MGWSLSRRLPEGSRFAVLASGAGTNLQALLEAYPGELADRIARYEVGLVVGAGYMRVLTPVFLERFPAVLNIHPSLLPEFRGLDAVKRALEAGEKRTGGEG